MLPDTSIIELLTDGKIKIDPFFRKFLGPNLYYCHLGQNFLVPKKTDRAFDPLTDSSADFFDHLHTEQPVVLKPHQFILAETFEFLGIDDSHVIRLYNSSSLARCGIVQAALGMINPGCGQVSPVRITLELYNTFPTPIVLTPTTVLSDGSVKWGTESLKISVEPLSSRPAQSYATWKYAAYGNDKKTASSKMVARFGKDKDYLKNFHKYTT